MPIATKAISVGHGLVTWIDAEDYDRVMQYHWYARHDGKSNWKVVSHKAGHLSRFILGVTDPKLEVDHKNHDTLDNQKRNLWISTSSQNNSNQRRRKDNVSGHKGVCYDNRQSSLAKRWVARIHINGKCHRLGYFYTYEQAITAYRNAALRHYGEFACFEEMSETSSMSKKMKR